MGEIRPRSGWRHRIKRLGAHQLAVLETDLRLIEQLQFFALRGSSQFGLERKPRFEFVADRALEKYVPPAAGGLGAIEREVGIAEEFVGGGAVVRINGDADADVDANMPVADGDGRFAEDASDIRSASVRARSFASSPLITMANSSPLSRATRPPASTAKQPLGHRAEERSPHA